MTEQGSKVDLKSLPFEERVSRFQTLVQAIGLGVGGDEEYTLRDLGRKIVKFHSMEEGDEREQVRENIHQTYDILGESTNPNVGEAVVNVVMSGVAHF